MEKLIHLRGERRFTLEEATEILPVIYRITEVAAKEVKDLLNKAEAIKNTNSEKASMYEEQINSIVDKWQEKVSRLGAHPKGLWLADFDFGAGYYCWKFPENSISFWHGYQDGFSGRIPLRSH